MISNNSNNNNYNSQIKIKEKNQMNYNKFMPQIPVLLNEFLKYQITIMLQPKNHMINVENLHLIRIWMKIKIYPFQGPMNLKIKLYILGNGKMGKGKIIIIYFIYLFLHFL